MLATTTRRHCHAVPLLHDYLIDTAARRPEHVALVTDERRWTYRELAGACRALAGFFADAGVTPGDRVVVLGENDARTCIAFWAALEANAVPVVVSPHIREKKLEYILGDCRPRALLAAAHRAAAFARPAAESPHLLRTVLWGDVDRELLPRVPNGADWDDACAPERDPGREPARRRIDVDLASIIYTSGSTGDAKGVMHTHRSMRTAATSIGAYLEKTQDDVIYSALPLSFDYGLYQMIMAFAAGARLVLERSFGLPVHALRRMAEEKATVFPGVPTMFAMLDGVSPSESVCLGAVRCVTNTAAALARKHVTSIRRLFPRARIWSMYGLTECKRVSYLPPEDLERKPGSVGIAIPNTEVWLCDERGEPVPAGAVGEVVVRGGTVMAGYWEKPEATAKVLVPGPMPGERVLRTGDYAVSDHDGYLYFLGRSDDVIKCRGEKVAPREVEEAILDVPGVREVAVVAVPDPILGQAPKAHVVLSPGATLGARDLLHECRKRLEPHMVPKEIVIRTELPTTLTGKVSKRELETEATNEGVIRVAD